jgi:hypothetical protein
VQEQIDAALLRALHEAFVPRSAPLVRLRVGGREVEPLLLHHDERLHSPKQCLRVGFRRADHLLERGVDLRDFRRRRPGDRHFGRYRR